GRRVRRRSRTSGDSLSLPRCAGRARRALASVMNNGGPSDHRRSARVPVALELEYRSAGAFLVAYTTNLSKGGIFVETSTPLPMGTTVAMRLHAPHSAVCEGHGTVAWLRPESTGPGQPAGMGIVIDTTAEQYGGVVDEI